MLKTIVLIIALLLVALWLYVRLAPIDPAASNLDPDTVPKPDYSGHVLVRPGDNIEPKTFAIPPSQLAARLDKVIMATPRTTRLMGQLESGTTTYVTRTALWGFPDLASVKIVSVEGGSAVRIFSRLRFGLMDMGVNRARVEGWLSQLENTP